VTDNNDDRRDQLIDVLLHEVAGDKKIPDLRGKVMAKISSRKPSRMIWILPVSVAASVMLIIGSLWLLPALSYPGPEIGLNFTLVSGQGGRGSVLATKDTEAELNLGGYCKVIAQEDTEIRIEGKDEQEQIYLVRGGVYCEVESGKGGFVVQTEAGSVSVKGTKFIVRLLEEKDEGEKMFKQLFVKVLAGAVIVSGSWGQYELKAGEEKTVGGGEKAIDIQAVKPEAKSKTQSPANVVAKLEKTRISVEYQEESLDNILADLTKMTGVKITSDVESGRKVSLSLKEMSAMVALKWLAKIIGSEVDVNEDGVFLREMTEDKIKKNKKQSPADVVANLEKTRISVDYQEESLDNILADLTKKTGVKITATVESDRKVSLNFKEVSAMTVLKWLASNIGNNVKVDVNEDSVCLRKLTESEMKKTRKIEQDKENNKKQPGATF
jgi:type II secretory pathway component PulM